MNDSEPLTMQQTAVGLHEFYTSLCEAGFTSQEALQIITETLRKAGNDT